MNASKLKTPLKFLVLLLSVAKLPIAHAIYNGTPEPDSSQYPFMVSIQIQQSNHWTHWCGGSLISPTMILTAGHCIANNEGQTYPPNMAQIVTRDGSTFLAKNFYLNPKFYWQTIPEFANKIAEYDLALIELATPVPNAKTVILPSINDAKQYYQPNNPVTAIGYGVYDMRCENNTPQYCNVSYPLLRSAQMTLLPDSQLKWSDVGDNYYSKVNPYLYPQLFVGVYSNLQSPTAHDSGSPLLVKNPQGNYVVIGTFSAGVGTPELFQPSVYTRLDTQDNLTWISQITGQNSVDK